MKRAQRKKRNFEAICEDEKESSTSQVESSKRNKSTKIDSFHPEHDFTPKEANEFTSTILNWYNSFKRNLPWRSLSSDLSTTDRVYAVLVSEVMLQQTQVATVIPYYQKWMSKWPTFRHLAHATLEDVNQVWAGLGYYGRAKRLWEAAKKVHVDMEGSVPLSSKELQENLPGVGRYTAAAVSSIVFGEKVAACDGNFVRVLSRVRCLGADSTSKIVLDHVWKLSEKLVSADQPGNFNQAMMDLGATICTPKKPLCSTCPVSNLCLANQRVQNTGPLKELQQKTAEKNFKWDIEDVPCHLCLPEPWDSSLGVMNFPRKMKKTSSRNEVTLVCIMFHVDDQGKYTLVMSQKRKGLLAGLWEFPNEILSEDLSEDISKELQCLESLVAKWGVSSSKFSSPASRIGVVPHLFSHINKKYVVYAAKLQDQTYDKEKQDTESKWFNTDDITSAAISTAMKKIYQSFCDFRDKKPAASSGRRTSKATVSLDKSTKKMTDFFKKSTK